MLADPPTYEAILEHLHHRREALVVDVIDGVRAFAVLRSGFTVMFPVEEPVALGDEVHVRPCAAWFGDDGREVRVFAHRVPKPCRTRLPNELAYTMKDTVQVPSGKPESWDALLDEMGARILELVGDDDILDLDHECEFWARRSIEARVDRFAPRGAALSRYEDAVHGARSALASIGFATNPDSFDWDFGIARFADPHPFQPWLVSHGTGVMGERDAWLAGLVDRVLRRFGFLTVWFGDPRESIEVQAFRPNAPRPNA